MLHEGLTSFHFYLIYPTPRCPVHFGWGCFICYFCVYSTLSYYLCCISSKDAWTELKSTLLSSIFSVQQHICSHHKFPLIQWVCEEIMFVFDVRKNVRKFCRFYLHRECLKFNAENKLENYNSQANRKFIWIPELRAEKIKFSIWLIWVNFINWKVTSHVMKRV